MKNFIHQQLLTCLLIRVTPERSTEHPQLSTINFSPEQGARVSLSDDL